MNQIPTKQVIVNHPNGPRVHWSTNHVLQYTQLKFKFDPLMKPEILGLIPNGVANLWTLPRSTDWRDSRIKTNMWRKYVVYEFWKIHPDKGRFLFGVVTYFLFLFLKWGKLSKNKNPSMTPIRRKWSVKLDFSIWGSGYLSGRYLIGGSTPLGPKSGLY